MKVKLLQDVIEGSAPKTVKKGEEWIQFTKGRIIEMSEASGKKYVEKGLGEEVVEDKPKEEKKPAPKKDKKHA